MVKIVSNLCLATDATQFPVLAANFLVTKQTFLVLIITAKHLQRQRQSSYWNTSRPTIQSIHNYDVMMRTRP